MASSSNFAISFSSYQISYYSAISFISIVLFFFSLFFFLLLLSLFFLFFLLLLVLGFLCFNLHYFLLSCYLHFCNSLVNLKIVVCKPWHFQNHIPLLLTYYINLYPLSMFLIINIDFYCMLN